MFDNKLKKLAKYLTDNKLTIATAESCTGGLLSSRLTDISGSSDFVKLNFVTYANEAKENILNVPHSILEINGAVSNECAYNMAKGLREKTQSDVIICTTGIAGPTGGTKDKPVGLVYISVYINGNISVKKFQLPSFLPRKIMKYMFTQKAISYACEVIPL